MMRRFWIVLAVLCLLPWGAVAILMLRPVKQTEIPDRLPTRMVLPEPTAITRRPTHPATTTVTATASQTITPTATATATSTSTPTLTATLATRVMGIEVVMPGVQLLPTATPFPPGTILLPVPPQPIEPLPDATLLPPPYLNWYSFESDHPAVVYATPWQARQVREASRGQYHRSDDVNSSTSFTFEGEGLRIRYVAARNMGMFDILVDGIKVDAIDAYASELRFPGTKVYFVSTGIHQLTIRSSGHKNAASEGLAVGLDAIQVFRGAENTLIIPPPSVTVTTTPVPVPASNIVLISRPSVGAVADATITSPQITISLVIAYDENGNRAVDLAEGIEGIPVRVVLAGTNRVIAQSFTDTSGYVALEIVLEADMRVVVPYFGRVWDMRRSRGNSSTSFSLLLPAGNQPGLIP